MSTGAGRKAGDFRGSENKRGPTLTISTRSGKTPKDMLSRRYLWSSGGLPKDGKRRPQLISIERMRLFVITDDKASLIFHPLVIVGAIAVARLVAALATISGGQAMTWLLLVVLAESGLTAFN